MASLTGCIKKAGKALSADDKAAILKAAQEHRADGMKATEAGRKAIADLLEAVRAELAEVEAADVEAPAEGAVLNQSGQDGRNLVALHNISADGLLNADKIGGLPAPSIGIGKVDAPFSGFGDITLIGRKDLIDPATGTPVFDSDAYSARFPDLVWPKAATKKALALIGRFRQDFADADDNHRLRDTVWDLLVNRPDKPRAVDEFARSRGGMLAYLRSRGQKVDIPARAVGMTYSYVNEPVFREWMDANREAVSAMSGLGYDDTKASPVYAEMSRVVAEAIDAHFAPLGESGKRDGIAKATKDDVLGDDGLMDFGPYNRIMRDASAIGKTETDTWALESQLTKAIDADRAAYGKWVAQQFDGLFAEPSVMVGKKKMPVTLDNIVAAMTSRGVVGAEKIMTYGGGKARAAMARRYRSLKEIQADRERIVGPEQHKAAVESAKAKVDVFQTAALEAYTIRDWRGNVDTWSGLDDSMRVLAAIGKMDKPTDAQVRAAFKKYDFANVSAETVGMAREAAQTMRDTPVDYFEAKPQRAVMLSEFGGAVVPSTTTAEARAVLEKAGVMVVEYDKDSESSRGAAIESLARELDAQGGDVLFQGADAPRAQIAFGQDVSAAASVISLLDGADWSSFLHEAGHFFLEVQADIAIKIQQQMAEGASVTDLERGIVEDFNAALRWMGVTGTEDATGKTGGAMDQAAFHGTPHRGIDKFSTDKIGTGEGAQAYGYGLYFAQRRDIAEWYREKLTGSNYALDGVAYNQFPSITESPERAIIEKFVVATDPRGEGMTPEEAVAKIRSDAQRALVQSRKNLDEVRANVGKTVDAGEGWGALREFTYTEDMIPEQERSVAYNERFVEMAAALTPESVKKNPGQLYEVDIPEDADMLLWDRPLSQQPEKVRAALADAETPKGSADVGVEATNLLRNLSQRDAGPEQLFSKLDIPSKRVVLAGVRGVLNNLKVRQAVVELVPIDVMNVLAGEQASSDALLDNPSMLFDLLAGDGNDAVPVNVNRADAAIRAIALAARTEGLLVEADAVRVPKNLVAAMRAGKLDQVHGDQIYRMAERELGSAQDASDFLRSVKVAGIKYLDGTSRNAGDGSYNYVIFSGDDVAIRQTFYQGGEQVPQEFPAQGRTPLDTWAMMSMAEKTYYHERFARGFEAYAFEGKAPSIALQGVFNRFRAWLKDVYRWLLKAHGDRLDAGLNAKLSDDIRGVMDRMIATDEAIEEAEAARGFLPLFKSAEDAAKFGWSLEKWQKYQALGHDATDDAKAKLSERALKDMKWLGRARDKALKARQREVEDQRREVRAEIRMEVYSEPVYRAWQFLTGKGDDDNTAKGEGLPKGSRAVDVSKDSLLVAIAKLGGISRDSAKRDAGVSEDDLKVASGVFGAPVFRKTGGRNADDMREALTELGYLHERDEFGRTDLRGLSDAISNELGGSPEYSFSKDYGPDASGDKIGEEQFFGKLNTEDMRLRYGNGADAIWRKLSALRMTSDTGLDADVVAEFFEFDSGDALVRALAEATPPREAIEARTDERMLQMFGDITSPEALARAADEAVMNKVRAKFLASEWKALEDATTKKEKRGKRSVDLMAIAAKEYAAQIVARLKVRDIKPAKYAAAAARNGKLSAKAFTSAKLEEAAMHKRNQTVNAYAADAAYEALHEVEKARAYLRKFDKRIKSIERGYQDQIEQLLERFDFKAASLKQIDRRKSLADWVAEQQAMGNEPSLPEDVLNEAVRKSYKDMTVEELRGLVESVKQIEHLGRLKNKLMLARDKRTFDAVADEMAATIVQFGGKARPVELEGARGVKPWFEGVAAQHRKLSSLFRQMDGGSDQGPLFEHIGRAMNERGTMEDVMTEKATVRLQELYAPLLKMTGGITGYRSKVFIKEINASLTRGGRLAVALNWGNEQNRQRIRDGDKWTDAQVNAILKTLTTQELEFVNGVWEYLDTFWPEVAAKEERLLGVAPEKVAAEPFVLKSADGTEVPMRGGYYPLKYDSDRSDRAEQQEAAQVAKEMMHGAYSRATTRRGHTKERLQEVKRPVRKDLNVITQHITQVVHDLAWHEWSIDTNRLLSDDRVVAAIRGHYGPKTLKTMRDAVMGIAAADVTAQTDIDKALLLLRSNVTRATMGVSITTAFLQPFGLTQSMVRIGPKHVLRGLARWGGDAARMESSMTWINEKSDFMRLRAKTFNRELREISGRVGGKSKALTVLDAGMFMLMQKMQIVADVPTWLGQYEKTKAEGPTEDTDEARDALEAKAIAMADRAVIESQGSGATKDLAEVQRKHPMLTQFYSYFSVTVNLTAERTATTDFRNPRAVAGWLGDMALLNVIPALLPAMILDALKGGDDDDEEWQYAKKIAQWQAGYLMGLVVGVRELSGAVSGFDYAGPPVGRIVGDLGKAGKQTAQGEIDEPAVLAYARLIGTAFGIPITQVMRSYKGWKAWDDGQEGAGPQSVLFGPPAK